MTIEARFETIREKKFIGKSLKMSFQHNRTGELWAGFMPVNREIQNRVGTDLYSLQLYDPRQFNPFNPSLEFEKWALAEVTDFTYVPAGMETFLLTGGLYAVFTHRGSNTDNRTFQYIFSDWLPASAYDLDNRPHFEVLGSLYKNNDPASEEEIWIPIRLR